MLLEGKDDAEGMCIAVAVDVTGEVYEVSKMKSPMLYVSTCKQVIGLSGSLGVIDSDKQREREREREII